MTQKTTNTTELRARHADASKIARDARTTFDSVVAETARREGNDVFPRPRTLDVRLALVVAERASLDASVDAAEARADLSTGLDAEDLREPALAACDPRRRRDTGLQLLEERRRLAEQLASIDAQLQVWLAEPGPVHAAWTARRLAAGDPPPAPLPTPRAPEALHRGQLAAPDILAADIVQQLDTMIADGGPRPRVDTKAAERDRLRVEERDLRVELGRQIEAKNEEKKRAAAHDRAAAKEAKDSAAAAAKAEHEARQRHADAEAEKNRLAAITLP